MKEQSSVMKSLQAPHHRLLQNNAKCQLFNKTALSHIVKHSVCDCESAFSPFHTFDRLGILPIYSFLQPIICLYKDKWMQCSGLISPNFRPFWQPLRSYANTALLLTMPSQINYCFMSGGV